MPLTPMGALGRAVLMNAAVFAPALVAIWMGLPKSAGATATAMFPVFYFMLVRKRRPEWVSMLLGAYGVCYGLLLALVAILVPVNAAVEGITVPDPQAYIAIIAGLFTVGVILIIIGTWVMSREHTRGVATGDAPVFN